jgi:predicted dehydrogenase
MSAPLTVIHVGCGGMAKAWLQPAAAHPDLRIVALVDLVPAAAIRRRDEFAPTAEAGADLAALLARHRPDLVFNCTVPAAHRDVTLAALRAGAHVLSEKPLAHSMAEARELVAAAAGAGRLLAVTQNYRYRAPARTVQATLATGALGELTTLHCDFAIGAHFGGFRDTMEHVLLLDMAIHHFDLARFFGLRRPDRVYCREWNPRGSWYHHGANAHALFTAADGVVFNYRGSWCAEGTPTSWNGTWRFTGTRGSLFWDGRDEIRLEIATPTGRLLSEITATSLPVRPAPAREDSHASVIAEFVSCIRQGTTPETAAADNQHSLAMVFAALASAAADQPVTLPDPATTPPDPGYSGPG